MLNTLSRIFEKKSSTFRLCKLTGSLTKFRSNLSTIINDVIFGEGQVHAIYNTWDDLFKTLARQAHSERLIVVLDEFPYLVAAYPPLSSILQRIWDHALKNSQFMLIPNGSFIGMMEETIIGYKAPLHGRRTAQYRLEPLDFLDARQFFLSYNPDESLRTYAVYGGSPAYLQTINPSISLKANILDGILTQGSILYDEVRITKPFPTRTAHRSDCFPIGCSSGIGPLHITRLRTGMLSIFLA